MTWEDFCRTCLSNASTITVEAYQGSGAYGDVYDQAASVAPCYVDDTRKLVRASDGQEVTSETTVYAPLDITAPVGSRITLPSGRITTVITSKALTSYGWAVPGHTELTCQ